MKIFCKDNTVWTTAEDNESVQRIKKIVQCFWDYYLNSGSLSLTVNREKFNKLCDMIAKDKSKVYKFEGIADAKNEDFKNICSIVGSLNDITKDKEEFPISVKVNGDNIILDFK